MDPNAIGSCVQLPAWIRYLAPTLVFSSIRAGTPSWMFPQATPFSGAGMSSSSWYTTAPKEESPSSLTTTGPPVPQNAYQLVDVRVQSSPFSATPSASRSTAPARHMEPEPGVTGSIGWVPPWPFSSSKNLSWLEL